MKIIDLFSGIGGFSLGFQRAGYQFSQHYFSEIKKEAVANYKYNFPNATYIGNITSIQPEDFTGIDIITFGSPCQNFSIAGRKEGLEGSQSSLIKHAIALVAWLKPSVFIWENVKGVLSSNGGADFWAILKEFANIGGYRIEWQLLNSSWVQAQNRERIFLIGHLAGRSECGIFPFTEDDFLSKSGEESKSQAPISGTLKANGNLNQDDTYIVYGSTLKKHNKDYTNSKIRVLTEVERERLQGFPDNWTQYGDYGGVVKPISRRQRYKLIGNAVTVDIVELIAKRLKFIEPINIIENANYRRKH